MGFHLCYLYMKGLVDFDSLLWSDSWCSGSHMAWGSLCLVWPLTGLLLALFGMTLVCLFVVLVVYGAVGCYLRIKCKSPLNHIGTKTSATLLSRI